RPGWRFSPCPKSPHAGQTASVVDPLAVMYSDPSPGTTHMTWTILPAAEALRAGRLSPLELLEACLARIAEQEPRVRAGVLVDVDRARAEALARQEELARGQDRGLLHGIPLGIKDIIDVFDWPTGCGSRLWLASHARQDAPVV